MSSFDAFPLLFKFESTVEKQSALVKEKLKDSGRFSQLARAIVQITYCTGFLHVP